MKAIFTLVFLFAVTVCFAQTIKPHTDSMNHDFRTKVFVLNTCQPNQLSLETVYDSIFKSRKTERAKPKKLEINVRDFTAFKITDINPLRYNYYINDELVTQFMAEAAQTTTNDIFSTPNLLTPSDIQRVSVFNIDWDKITDEKKYITELKSKIALMRDSIAKAESILQKAYDDLYAIGRYDTSRKDDPWVLQKGIKREAKNNSILNARKQIAFNDETIVYNLSDELMTVLFDFEKGTSNLAASNVTNPFQDYYSDKYHCDVSSGNAIEHDRIITNIQQFVKKSIEMKTDLDSLYYNLFIRLRRSLPTSVYYYDYYFAKDTVKRHTVLGKINTITSKYGYSSYYNENNYNNSGDVQSMTKHIEDYTKYVSDMVEFFTTKKIQAYEDFLVTTSAAMGKLLQNKYVTYSQEVNSYSHHNCISKADRDSLDSIKADINCSFKLIQDLSADFTVAIQYLNINNTEIKTNVTNINKYYAGLLDFLKLLNHLEENNTIEFTFPSHNNLKNVDLVRYKINRNDQLTKGSQTYVYDMWIRGGLKVDFSAGVFTTALTDYSFSKAPVYGTNNDTVIANKVYIVRKNEGKVNFAFGGMVNIIPRLGASWFAPGISFGLAYTTSQKLQYLGGIALQMGKTERLMLHAGWACGMATRLDESQLNALEVKEKNRKYEVNGTYNDFNIPTIERFKGKLLFGLTYNLTKGSRLQEVTDASYTKNSAGKLHE